MKKNKGKEMVFDKLDKFLNGLEVCLNEIRPHLDPLLEEVRTERVANTVGDPEVVYDGNELQISIPNNMVAFCGSVKRYESLVCYLAMRQFVRSWMWDDDDTIDQAADTLYFELAAHKQRKGSWWCRLFDKVLRSKKKSPLAVEYYIKYQQGKRLLAEYRSLL